MHNEKISKAAKLFDAGVKIMVDNPSRAFPLFIGAADLYESAEQVNLSQKALEYAFSCQMEELNDNGRFNYMLKEARKEMLCQALKGKYEA